MNRKIRICDLKQCCNCGCCKEICPKNAISLIENNVGEIVPEINDDLCIECGICVKKCIVNNKPIFRFPQAVYAAYALDSEIHSNSASGGIASVFYNYCLSHVETAYGVVEMKNHDIKIQRVTDISEVQGSKYVKSVCNECFSQIRTQLKEGQDVLYIGLPCQVAALLSYLGGSHPSLVTVDLICHGAPPLKFYKEYVDSFHHKFEFDHTFFRDKGQFVFGLKDREKAIYKIPSYRDLYFHSFLSGLTYCSGCYSCKFAQINRISDVTIGDFWGIEETGKWNGKTRKASAVLVNTEKGQKFVDSCADELYIEKQTIEDVVKYNAQLRAPSQPHPERKKFLKNYQKKGFIYGVKSTSIRYLCVKNTVKDILKGLICKF